MRVDELPWYRTLKSGESMATGTYAAGSHSSASAMMVNVWVSWASRPGFGMPFGSVPDSEPSAVS